MKTMVLVMMMYAMGACAVQPQIETGKQGLVCDPNCDPGGQQSVVVALYNMGQGFGYQTTPAYCRDQYSADEGIYYTLCSGIFADDGGNQTSIFCNDQSGGVHCYWWNCGGTGEPDCHL